jgi:uncharacterized membrane protein
VLLLIPSYSQRDAWSALSEQANFYAITRLDPANSSPLILVSTSGRLTVLHAVAVALATMETLIDTRLTLPPLI